MRFASALPPADVATARALADQARAFCGTQGQRYAVDVKRIEAWLKK